MIVKIEYYINEFTNRIQCITIQYITIYIVGIYTFTHQSIKMQYQHELLKNKIQTFIRFSLRIRTNLVIKIFLFQNEKSSRLY